MSEQNNAELIAEANKLLAENQWTSGWGVESLAERLAERLEAADQRAAEYAAVVEKAGRVLTTDYHGSPAEADVLPILATVPADALRELKADVWDEGLKAGLREGNDKARGVVNNPPLNPYRKGQS